MLALQRRRSLQGPRTAGPTDPGTDTVSVSDTATRLISLHLTALVTITESDSAEKFPLQRNGTDTVSVGDTAPRRVTLLRAAFEVVALSDFAARPVSRSASDTVNVTEGAPHLGVNPHDAVSASDVALRLIALLRSGSDSVTVSDISHRTIVRSASDTAAVSEAAVHLGVNPQDTAAVSDTARLTGQGKVLTEIVAVGEGAQHLGVNPTDIVAVGEGAQHLGLGLADVIAASDVAVSSGSHARTASDAISVSDLASGPVTRAPRPVYNGVAARRQRGGVGYRR